MSNRAKILIIELLGVIISVAPTALAVISYFPIWRERGAATTLSGIALCLFLVSAVPLFRFIKSALKSPSAPMIWFILFIIFSVLSRIAEDMTVISFIGFVSNLLGALLFYLARAKKGQVNEK